MYKVVYLPQARRELEEAVMYIASELYAPDSAAALLDEIDHAVQQLKEMPYRHGLYPSLYALKNEVRFFPIKNAGHRRAAGHRGRRRVVVFQTAPTQEWATQ